MPPGWALGKSLSFENTQHEWYSLAQPQRAPSGLRVIRGPMVAFCVCPCACVGGWGREVAFLSLETSEAREITGGKKGNGALGSQWSLLAPYQGEGSLH